MNIFGVGQLLLYKIHKFMRNDKRERISGLQQDYCYGHLIRIPGADLESGRLWLAGGFREPYEGTEELGTDGKDTGIRGQDTMGLGMFPKTVVDAYLLFLSET